MHAHSRHGTAGSTDAADGHLLQRPQGPRHDLQARHAPPLPERARQTEEKYGVRFVGWFNVTEGSTWNNVLILDLPNYAVLDQLYADPGMRGFGHRVAESIFE